MSAKGPSGNRTRSSWLPSTRAARTPTDHDRNTSFARGNLK
jgi:hypothetical protein